MEQKPKTKKVVKKSLPDERIHPKLQKKLDTAFRNHGYLRFFANTISLIEQKVDLIEQKAIDTPSEQEYLHEMKQMLLSMRQAQQHARNAIKARYVEVKDLLESK